MLTLIIPEIEIFNEETQEFYQVPDSTLKLEHSLVSISKWEARWHIPFLDEKHEKTAEQTIDYIKCMTINQVDQKVYLGINNEHIAIVNAYIENPMSATTFYDPNGKESNTKKQIVTSELIYGWMVMFKIPSEYQKWHLNRLINLIRICEIQNTPPKKKSKRDIIARNAELNAKRRQMLNSKG